MFIAFSGTAVIRSPSEEEFAPGYNDLLDKSLKIRSQYELMMPARVQVLALLQ